MTNLFNTFKNNWKFILTIAVGTLALVTYILEKRNEKRNAAILIVSQIDELKEKISKIVEIISASQLNATEIYEILDILDDNQWNKYKHLFVGKIDSKSIRIINEFYEGVSKIREQLILAKKMQQQSFFNIQQKIADNCNDLLRKEYEINNKTKTNNLKTAIGSIPAQSETEKSIKETVIKIIESQQSIDSQNLINYGRYFNELSKIKTVFSTPGIFIAYLPDQIYVTIKKELDKLSYIEIIGCSGYEKLKKISKIKF